MKNKSRFQGGQLLVFLLMAAVLVGLDQFTKQLAVSHLQGQERIELIPQVLYLLYVENFGAAFGMMQGMQYVFYVITVIVMLGIVYVVGRMPGERRYLPMLLVCLLVFSGAVGNLIDRVAHQYVVDFIYFSPINFPVFNVADIYVTCGCGLMIFLFLIVYKDEDFSFLHGGIWKKN